MLFLESFRAPQAHEDRLIRKDRLALQFPSKTTFSLAQKEPQPHSIKTQMPQVITYVSGSWTFPVKWLKAFQQKT
jgi:hypothetical protein